MNFCVFLLCHLFKVEYRVNLLKRINLPNCSFPKFRDNISRDFPQESEVVAALLRRFDYLINLPNCSFPKSRDNISRDFPQESEVVATLLRGFNYLYKVSVYQIKFDWSQASCPIGTAILYKKILL
jgi:hypothetical protein